MTSNIKTAVVSEVCARIQDMLLTAVEEETKDFFTLNTTIDLLESFHDKGLDLDISIFTEAFMDTIYTEIRTYLSKQGRDNN